jgi:hypothetical protein
MTLKKWRGKGESLRVDRYRCIEGRCLYQIMSAKTKVTKDDVSRDGPGLTWRPRVIGGSV